MIFVLKLFVCLLSHVLNFFPHGLLIFMGRLLGEAFFRIIRFRRGIVFDNMKRALSDEIRGGELRSLVRKNYHHYGCVLIDCVLSVTWEKKDYLKQVEVEGLEKLTAVLGEGKGCFLVSCHLGTWELIVGALMARGIPLDIIVKKSKSEEAENLLRWYRQKTGVNIYYESGTHFDILRAVSRGRVVAFFLDQFMGPPIGLPVSFFGELAGTAASLALMLERDDAPAVIGYCVRRKRGRLNVVIDGAVNFPSVADSRVGRLYERTQFLNDLLERVVRKYPEQWLWIHRRWKTYNGKPRWELKTVLMSIFVGVLIQVFSGCASVETSKTGIEVPPDPTVAVPVEFKEQIESENVVSASEDGGFKSIERAREMGIVVTPGKKETGEEKLPKKKKKLPKTPERKKGDLEKENSLKTSTEEALFEKIPKERIPFRVGERMEIHLYWMALPAGRVVMEVRDGGKFNGRDTFRFWGNVLSSKLVDTIYHVDNTIESFVDMEGLIPYKFLLHMVETVQLKETKVVFDHLTGKAHYWSKRVSEKLGNETIDSSDEFLPLAQDMYSGLYYVRTFNYKMGKTFSFKVFEKGKHLEVKLVPMANELVTTKIGVFQAWKLSAEVYLGNQLRQTGKSYFWISDDSNRFLVKFDASLRLGSLKGTLVSVREKL